MSAKIQAESKQHKSTVDLSLIKNLFQAEDGLIQYKALLNQTSSLEGLQFLAHTLATMRDNWTQCSDFFEAEKLKAILVFAVQLFNEKLASLKTEEFAADEAGNIINPFISNLSALFAKHPSMKPSEFVDLCPINILLSSSRPFLENAQAIGSGGILNSQALFVLLQALQKYHLLFPADLVDTLCSIHALVLSNALSLNAKQAKWIENQLQNSPRALVDSKAVQCLSDYALQTKSHLLKSTLQPETVDILLRSLCKKSSHVEVEQGLYSLWQLVDKLALQDLTALKMPMFDDILNHISQPFPKEDKKQKGPTAEQEVGTVSSLAATLKYIAKITVKVNEVANTPKKISARSLKRVLEKLATADKGVNWAQQASQVLLSVGQIIRAGRYSQQEKASLHDLFANIVSVLNNEQSAAQMDLPAVAHVLNSLVMMGFASEVALTTHLRPAFQKKLTENSQALDADQRAIYCHQVAQYLFRSGLCHPDFKLPDWLQPYILSLRPEIKKDSLHYKVFTRLKELLPESYDCNIEALFCSRFLDILVENKLTNEKYVFELDGPQHLQHGELRVNDVESDDYLRGLKDETGQNIFKLVSRFPTYPPYSTDPDFIAQSIANKILSTPTNKNTLESKKSATKPAVAPSFEKRVSVKDPDTEADSPKKLLEPFELAPSIIPEIKKPTSAISKQPFPKSFAGLLLAIDASDIAAINWLLSNLKALNDEQKADLLTKALNKENSNAILPVILNRCSATVITTVSKKEGASPLAVAVQKQDYAAVDAFILKNRIPGTGKKKKHKRRQQAETKQISALKPFNHPEWQGALELAQKTRSSRISEALRKAGVTPSSVPATPCSTPEIPKAAEEKKRKVAETKKKAQEKIDLGNNTQLSCDCCLCLNQSPSEQLKQQLIKLAVNGEGAASYALAIMNRVEDATPAQIAAMMYWLEQAVEQNNPEGQLLRGQFYDCGMDVVTKHQCELNHKEAFRLMKLAADQGLGRAEVALAGWYLTNGTENDAAKGLDILNSSTHPNAKGLLGVLYLSGQLVPKDEEKACKYLQLAASKGDTAAKNLLNEYNKGVDLAQTSIAPDLFQKSPADNKLAISSFDAGVEFYHQQNIPAAIKNFRRSVELDFPPAKTVLAKIYLNDQKETHGKKTEAVELLKSAAAQGDDDAQVALAQCYQSGKGIGKDIQQAKKIYQKFAAEGRPDAQCKLAVLLLANEEDINIDIETVLNLLQSAAAQGYESAKEILTNINSTICELGLSFELGAGIEIAFARGYHRSDSEQDLSKAKNLYQLAAKYGSSAAKAAYGRLLAKEIKEKKDQPNITFVNPAETKLNFFPPTKVEKPFASVPLPSPAPETENAQITQLKLRIFAYIKKNSNDTNIKFFNSLINSMKSKNNVKGIEEVLAVTMHECPPYAAEVVTGIMRDVISKPLPAETSSCSNILH